MEKKIKLKYRHQNGMKIVEINHDERYVEFLVTIDVPENKNARKIQDQILKFLKIHGNAQIIKLNLFSSSEEWINLFLALNKDIPVSCTISEMCREGIIAGIYLHAISGLEIQTIIHNDEPAGRMYENEWMKCAYLTDIRSREKNISKIEETSRIFSIITETLSSAGMSLTNIVRYWWYIDHILSWYSDFNHVRTDIFRSHQIFEGVVPVSTGISAGNHARSGLFADVLALSIKNQEVNIQPVPSPLQCPALDYKSSFSRAIEINTPGYNQLLISGTASIDVNGKSVHHSDVRSQINQTMKVIEAILTSRQMDWDNITRAIAYFKNPEDITYLNAFFLENNIPDLPMLVVTAGICRDELLFEMEADAILLST